MISTRCFVSLATRVRIRSHRSNSSLPSQGFYVWRLILSDEGVLTATIQLFLLNIIRLQEDSVRRHHGFRRAAGCSLSGRPSISPITGGGLLTPRWERLSARYVAIGSISAALRSLQSTAACAAR